MIQVIATRPPAAPHSAPLIANVVAYTRLVSMPRTFAARAFCAVARIAWPSRDLFRNSTSKVPQTSATPKRDQLDLRYDQRAVGEE